MNTYLLIAGVLTFVLGLAHSVIGEVLIFQHWRNGEHKAKIHNAIPIRHRRIIWASWHVVTIMGWGMAGILFWLALPHAQDINMILVKYNMMLGECVIMISMFAGALFVLAGTRGKHPGWVVMLIIAILIWLS